MKRIDILSIGSRGTIGMPFWMLTGSAGVTRGQTTTRIWEIPLTRTARMVGAFPSTNSPALLLLDRKTNRWLVPVMPRPPKHRVKHQISHLRDLRSRHSFMLMMVHGASEWWLPSLKFSRITARLTSFQWSSNFAAFLEKTVLGNLQGTSWPPVLIAPSTISSNECFGMDLPKNYGTTRATYGERRTDFVAAFTLVSIGRVKIPHFKALQYCNFISRLASPDMLRTQICLLSIFSAPCLLCYSHHVPCLLVCSFVYLRDIPQWMSLLSTLCPLVDLILVFAPSDVNLYLILASSSSMSSFPKNLYRP